MLPPVRSFSISSSRENGCVWLGAEALAAAAASWMSGNSMSESSAWGVPVTISGAITEMDWSLPGRFSLPPLTRDGRRGCRAWILPVVEVSSGVAEPLRLVADGRGRFWPAVDLGCFCAFEAGAADFWDFFEGASGAGHSTSWVRSRRSEGIHSAGSL